MAIDIRAKVLCNDEYEVISGSISDDYIQGTGVITTKGSCVLNGAVKLKQGDRIWFTYAKYYKDVEVIREIPRTLLVRSSFYDPLRGTTTIDMGCPLYYAKDTEVLPADKFFKLADSLNLDENGEVLPENTNVITSRIVWLNIVLNAWGALGFPLPLVPIIFKECSFSIEEYEFTQPYLDTLIDFYISVSKVAYYDWKERNANFIDLSYPGGGDVPLLSNSKIIDISPSQFGELEATSVIVDFSYLKLKVPEGEEVVCDVAKEAEDEDGDGVPSPDEDVPSPDIFLNDYYSAQTQTSTTSTVAIPYSIQGVNYTKIYPTLQTSTSTSGYVGAGGQDVVTSRTTTEQQSVALVAGAYMTAWLSTGGDVSNYMVNSQTVETFSYDSRGNEVFRSLVRTADAEHAIGDMNLPYTFNNPDGTTSIATLNPGVSVTLEKITVDTYQIGGIKRTITRRWVPWARTISGQQSIAEARETWQSLSEVVAFVNSILAASGLYLLDVTVDDQPDPANSSSTNTSSSSTNTSNSVNDKDTANSLLTDPEEADPSNGYRTESTAETELISGATGDNLLIRKFSVPLSPDDAFIAKPVPGSDPTTYCYSSEPGPAPGLALIYGETQNRLLLGNRNGMNVQIAPEDMPTRPFSPVMLLLERRPGDPNRIYAEYYTNGATWTFDSSGLICSFDALYWGTAGK